MKIKINKLHPDAIIPRYAHGSQEDAGMDLCAVESVMLIPGTPTLVRIGLSIELPPGFEAQIRPRSGLALHGITVINSPGTIDPGYRGEIQVVLFWAFVSHFQGVRFIKSGDRIAQMVIARYEQVEFQEGVLGETARGSGGFGSTDVNSSR